ncbi:MAG TPA: BrnT family toxin [Rhodopseudomonas sp.]|uniref:BrnT family toxin n=1 Tax=Rhodopseudomonas sp. TaxID=1078 RepID=UPI002EDB443F
MFSLDQITGFDWDPGNARKSTDKHGISQAEAEQVFVNKPLLFLDDPTHSKSEVRYHAYGKSNAGRLLQVSFTLRQDETLLRIISARPMSARERARYAEEA